MQKISQNKTGMEIEVSCALTAAVEDSTDLLMVHSSCNMFRSSLSSALSFDVRMLNRRIHTTVSWILDLHKALNFNAV